MVGVASGAVVAGTGAGLVDTSPSGPGQVEVGGSGDGSDQFREQATDFGDGQRDESSFGGPPAFGRRDGGEDCRGEHDQGGVAVPGVPPADLVLIETEGAFRVLEARFDGPSGASDAYQCG